MNNELEYLLKTTSDCEACSDQESVCLLLTDLQAVADDLDLDFTRASVEATILAARPEPFVLDPCI
jgi:hypothetical protein